MTREQGCYMCPSLATSREHAPPSSFFPELGTFGRDLRKNLITVPSCDLHNGNKSKDDEFFRATLLLATARHSQAAQHQFFQKLLAASKRNPVAHAAFVTEVATIEKSSSKALRIDRQRFDKCVDHLARALFFDAYKSRWELPLLVVSPNLFSAVEGDRAVVPEDVLKAVEITRLFLQGEAIRGENKEVFQYRLKYDETAQSFAVAAQFFGLFEVFCYSSAQMAATALV